MITRQAPSLEPLIASEAERAKIELQRQQEQKENISSTAEQARGLINQGKQEVTST